MVAWVFYFSNCFSKYTILEERAPSANPIQGPEGSLWYFLMWMCKLRIPGSPIWTGAVRFSSLGGGGFLDGSKSVTFFLFSLKSKEGFFPLRNSHYSGDVILNVLFLYGSFFNFQIFKYQIQNFPDVENFEMLSLQWSIIYRSLILHLCLLALLCLCPFLSHAAV